ncbi:MAG: hypothetical protein DI537_13780 [Stutzerimonas stutzeri]|nr:MAG: hypothetical protein DI537_13780 [Stutzerimonas stutzeri]
MIFDVLTQRLVDKGLGVPGESIFHNFMGAEVMRGVMFRTPLTGIPVDPYIEGRHSADIQVITRHTDPVEGMNLANAVSRALVLESPRVFEIAGNRIQVSIIYPKTMPIQFPRLEGNNLEFSQHFFTVFAMKPLWRD